MKNIRKICRRGIHGLSMIELMAVLFIIGVMISLAAPYFGGASKGSERHAAAKTVATLIRQARQMAVSKSAVYRVRFNNYEIWIEDVPPESIQQVGKTYYLPENIVYDTDDIITRPLPIDFDFEPQGHISTSANDIYLEHKGKAGLYDKIVIYEETGQIEVIKDTN